MHPSHDLLRARTRRQFLGSASLGLGGLALADLAGDARADVAPDPKNPLALRPPHFAPKAKRVIYLHMSGGPPHLDLLDYKPELVARDGQNCPDEYLKGKRFAFTSGVPKLLGTRRKFGRVGRAEPLRSDGPGLSGRAGVSDRVGRIGGGASMMAG